MRAPDHVRTLPIALIALATTLVYVRSLAGGFVSDDVSAVVENPLLRALSLANLYRIATSFDDANYIPLNEPPSFYAQLNLARAYLRRATSSARAQAVRHCPRFWSAEERELARAERRGS